MLGYSVSLQIITKIKKPKEAQKTDYKYTVTVMIVAHNEEAVIGSKLENVIDNDYPQEKIKYLITSDNSDDMTNEIVKSFIKSHPEINMQLYISKERKGKTNAQNEAQKLVDTDILIMTDANSIFKHNAISELVSSFVDESVVYVCGTLVYSNIDNPTAGAEAYYWNGELQTRLMESNIGTITAGNGAIYACRNKDYVDFPPIECHDSSMPYYYGKQGKRAIYNKNAIAYEKAGESTEDEFKRKVRMNRVIFMHIRNGLSVLNPFKYGWFAYFYFGHRTSRYLLWLNHLLVFITGVGMAIIGGNIWKGLLVLQLLFYVIGGIGKYAKSKSIHMVYYYCITILAQWKGVINAIMGNEKPIWDSVSSTR